MLGSGVELPAGYLFLVVCEPDSVGITVAHLKIVAGFCFKIVFA